jgi:hypothetical protein
MAAEASGDAGRFCRQVEGECGQREYRSGIQARSRGFLTQKTANSYAEYVLRKQQKLLASASLFLP